jgi:hypothetical protein
MTDRATSQADNIVPPRKGATWAVDVDSTARRYLLTALTLGRKYEPGRRDDIYVTLQADGADVFFVFSDSSTVTLDDTAAQAAGNADAAFAATYGAKIVSGTESHYRISRALDQYIHIKTSSGTGVLRMWASSEPQGK